jgi:hypothetical protein
MRSHVLTYVNVFYLTVLPRLEPGHHDHLPTRQLRGRRPPREGGQPDRAGPHAVQPDGDLYLLPGALDAASGADSAGPWLHHRHLPLVRRRLPRLYVLHLPHRHVPAVPGRARPTLLCPR